MRSSDERTAQSVLELLRPLQSGYVQRANPVEQLMAPGAETSKYLVDVAYTPCCVEATVRVDSKGRVSWPSHLIAGRAATIELGEGISVDVTFETNVSSNSQQIDGRGRLQLRQGTLQAAGIRPGDRVVLIRRLDRDGISLIGAGGLGVRRGLG